MTQQVQTTANTMSQPQTTKVGFFDAASYKLLQSVAAQLSQSGMVPARYRYASEKNVGGKKEWVVNDEAIPNCAIAVDLANQMNIPFLTVMQNLYIIEGNPSWSSKWIIAGINRSGRFTPLQFEITDEGEKEMEYEEFKWENRQRVSHIKKIKIRNLVCVAWAKSTQTGEVVKSSPVSIEMAVKEGWYGKNGSKWKTMPEQMLRYRSASFFGNVYAPDLTMGFVSQEEAEEIAFIETAPTGEVVESTVKVTKGKMKKAEAVAEPEPAQAAEPEPVPEANTVQVDDQTIDTDTGEVLQAAEDYPLNPDDAAEDDIFAGIN